MGKKLIIKGADFSANAIGVITYSVILNANDSTLGTVSGSGNYEPNSVITISATPIENAYFVKWSDNNTDPVRQLTVTESINLTAYFSTVPPGYGEVTFDGTEDWQFNSSDEPNSHGIYNCYLLNPDIVNPKLGTYTGYGASFYAANCNILSLNRLIETSERRVDSASAGFGYKSDDPSVFFRFDNTIATSVATFKAYLAENNITIIYKQNE